MAMDYTKAFALTIENIGAVQIAMLESVGAPPGVYISFVKARNGPGMGKLRTGTAKYTTLSWRAPGSGVFGRAIPCPSNGPYMLEDGEDHDKAITVQVYSDYLEAGAEASVLLIDVYGARYGFVGDVTAAMASSGHVQGYSTFTANESAGPMTDLKVWLDPDTNYYEISDDNATWVSPTNEATALALATPIAPGARDTLWFRRTIPSSCSSDPKVLMQLHFSFVLGYESLPRKHYVDTRGLYRIFNAVAYRFYRSNSAPPEEDDEPFDTHSTLPHTPVQTYADGTWYISVSYFNGVLDSGFLPIGPNGETCLRLDLAAGAEEGSPPNAPLDWQLELRPGGVVRIIGTYYQVGDLRATQWAIAYTTDESAPATDDPDETEAMPVRGLAQLAYDLPAQDHDTIVKVRLQTRRQDGETWVYSEDSTVLTVTADADGPSTPITLERYPGRLPESL